MNRKSAISRSIAAISSVALALTVGIATNAPSASAANKGGTLTFITNADNFAHADPGRIYTGQDIAFFESYLYRTLVMYAPYSGAKGSNLVGDLATNTGVSSDGGKTWSFTLRDGITYSDGSAITCADVKYAVSRTFATDVITDGPAYARTWLNIPKDSKGESTYAGPYAKTGQAAYDKAVTCTGKTIAFHLNTPVSDFNYVMAYPISSPIKASADTGDKYDLAPLTEGPYKIQTYTNASQLIMVRNPKWNAATDKIRTPFPDKVVVRFGVSEDVRDQIILDDSEKAVLNLDGLQLQNNIAFWASPASKTRGMNVLDPYTSYPAANVSAGHLDCLEVRKAVFFAWNTLGLIKLSGGTQLFGTPGDNAIKPNEGLDYAPTTGNIHDKNWKITGNPAYAKKLLAEAKTKCPVAYERATNPSKGITYDRSDTASSKKAAVVIKAAFEAAGLVVKFNYIPRAQYYPTIQDVTKQGDISGAGWGPDWANASTVIPPLFIKDGGFNLSQNWDDPAYPAFKKIVDAANAETNRAKQAALWKEASQYAQDQYWLLNITFTKQQLEWTSGVQGVQFWGPQGTFLFPRLSVK